MKVKDIFPKMPIGEEGKLKLSVIIKELGELQGRLDRLILRCFDSLDVTDSQSVKRINLISFLSKILEINNNFLKTFINVYELEESTLFTTLSRGIFELHLILLEATSSDESFTRISFQGLKAYESFINMFKKSAEKRGKEDELTIWSMELERISSLKNKYEKLFQANLESLGKLKHHIIFDELAEKHGLSEEYDSYYKILSSFLHPTFLYLQTTAPKDRTLPPESIELALRNIKHRKLMIKSIAVVVAFDFSLRTKQRIEKFLMKATK